MIFCRVVELAEQVEYIRSLALPTKARVLEVGCGTGPLLRRVACEFPEWKLTGIDLYVAALARGCMLAAADRLGIDFLQIDLYQMPYEDGTFDLVYTRNVLEGLCEPERALQELQRVVKADGKLVLFEQMEQQ